MSEVVSEDGLPNRAAYEQQHHVQAGRAQGRTCDVLVAYDSVLDLISGRGFVVRRPRRRLTHLKPPIGVESHVVDHIRTSVELFSRRCSRRLALGQGDEEDLRDRDALDQFTASLPPRRPRIWILLPYLVALAATQIWYSSGGYNPGGSGALHDLVGLISPKPQDITSSADHLIRHGDLEGILGVLVFGSVALWLSFRPIIWGFRVNASSAYFSMSRTPHAVTRPARNSSRLHASLISGGEKNWCATA